MLQFGSSNPRGVPKVGSIIPVFSRSSGWSDRLEFFWDLLFPRSCVCCGQDRRHGGPCLCAACQDHLNRILPPFCAQCGYPAPLDYPYPTELFRCVTCRKQGFAFDRARSLGTYESVFKSLVQFFKYQRQPGALREIRPLLEAHVSEEREAYAEAELVPVPLHRDKLRDRGFDQSWLLAREIGRILDRPVGPEVVIRVRETPTQTRLRRLERLRNLRGAFEVLRPERIQGRRVLVVDDVMTTGATAHEMARTLKRAGAREVHVFTLARAP